MEQILVTFECWQVFVLVFCRTAEKRPGCLVYVAGKSSSSLCVLFAGNERAIPIWNRHLEVQSVVVDGRLEGTSPEHHLPENLSQTRCFDVYIITEGI
jgi:hypothetical protein